MSLLSVKGLKTYFPVKGGILSRVVGHLRAVDGVDLELKEGETLGLVGESGCGKSTLGRSVLRLEDPQGGTVHFDGQDVLGADKASMKALRRQMQMIFQDPFSSLDPRMSIERIVTEPFRLHGMGTRKEQRDWAVELLETVGLRSQDIFKYPHEFSGGQRQRVGIARALALKPKFVVADEPIAALDVSIQAQVLNLMGELKKKFGLTYLFISHDLSVVRYFSDRVAVMYLGRIVETASSADIYRRPRHPYTQALMSAIPSPDPRKRSQRQILQGDVPSPLKPPSGCAFHPRCPHATEECRAQLPELRTLDSGHEVRCHHAEKISPQGDA